MRQSLLAGASSFAHLLGRGPSAARAAEEDDDKQRDGESDEDFEKRKKAKGKRAEDGDDDKQRDGESDEDFEKRKKAKGKRAEDDGDKQRDGESDEDFEKRKKAKGKRAEGDDDEEGDDGSDGADMRTRGVRSARLRERARCAAIFADASAGKNPALAAQIAFGTDLPRGQALNVLRAGGLAVSAAAPRLSLDARMAAVKVPVIGAGDGDKPTGAQGLAAQILAAGKKRRGEA